MYTEKEILSITDISWFLNAISDGALLLSEKGEVLHVNVPASIILGCRPADLLGRRVSESTATPEELDRVLSALELEEVVVTEEVQFKGERPAIPVMLTAMKAPSAVAGQPLRYLLLFYDISPPFVNFSARDRKELLDSIFHEMGSGILLHYANGRLARMNDQARNLLGIQGELSAENWEIQDENGRKINYDDAPFFQVLRSGQSVENQVLAAGQESRYLLANSCPLFLRPGMRPMVITTLTDLDPTYRDRMRRESSIKLSQEINALLRELLTERGPKETLEAALRGAMRITGGEAGCAGLYRSEVNTVEYNAFVNLPEITHLEIPFRRSIFYELASAGREGTLSVDDFTAHPAAIAQIKDNGYAHMLGALIYCEGKIGGMMQIFNRSRSFSQADEDNLRALLPGLSAALLKINYEVRLNTLANRDGLTNLSNRRHATDSLQREIDRASRYGSPLSAIMLDIDFFKRLNDEHGHLAGDQVLVELSRIMLANTRKSDLVARTGGEEFMIVLPETQLSGCLHKAQNLQEAINAARIQFGEVLLQITVSMGCAQYRTGESMDDFYSRLDELLYSSKGEGRNRITAPAV